MFGRALILDDQPTMAGTAALLVAILGYEAIQCHLPVEALCRLRAESFDVLLTDYEMPLLTGLDVVEGLRQEDCLVPVIMMSGNVGRIDRNRAWRLGVTTILAKPFGMDELAEALRSTRGSISP